MHGRFIQTIYLEYVFWKHYDIERKLHNEEHSFSASGESEEKRTKKQFKKNTVLKSMEKFAGS